LSFSAACVACVLGFASFAATAAAQITIDSKTGAVTNNSTGATLSTVDRRYQQIVPTKVPLTKTELDAKSRLDLIRTMQAEQGFAMRPFPRGHKGLTLAANGKLEPAGEQYVAMATSQGISAKPGDRLVLTDVKIDHSKIIFDLNGGPDPRHNFLRHIEIGAGPATTPVVQSDGQEPVGARLTLTFQGHVPALNGSEVKALLAPLISFDVKTPIQAFTDTLPAKLKDAILNHHVLVGMSTDMVLFAKGQPDSKSREMDGQMPFEEWMYGKPPNEVDFVRINGNRVIRLEVAKTGEPPVIFSKDEVEGLMRTDGTALEADATRRVAKVGDVERDPNKEAPAAPPSLRNPGETLPSDDPRNRESGAMKPVQFPKPKADPLPGANPDGVPDDSTPAAGQPAPADPTQPTSAQPPATKPQMLLPAAP
jgi:predicted lipoprotein with Yx(FWY)xxD motif